MSRSLYGTWWNMKARCLNPNQAGYRNYGGRGIKVCDRWMSYENFAADVGTRPEGTSLDRLDVDGNYEPGNVRWSTPLEQARNSRGRLDLTGSTFAHLTAMKIAVHGRNHVFWHCVCSCGTHTVKRSDRIVSGKVTSCGCKNPYRKKA